MTFEEFFKKKRIDLAALEKAEPVLFGEFKTHFEQMGEKSFDHTKKYWFNKLRRQYQLALEIKTEKPHIANPLAEQTITESLGEKVPIASTPKMGFIPKLRAGSTSDTTVPKKEEVPAAPVANNKEETTDNEPAAPKLGFIPKFKAGITKPVTEQKEEPSTNEQTSTTAPKLGFTPKFKAGITKPVSESKEEVPEQITTKEKKAEEPQTTSEPVETAPQEPTTKPAGFTPRFKMKPKEEQPENNTAEEKAPAPEADTQEKKPAYKPRFVPPKKKEE